MSCPSRPLIEQLFATHRDEHERLPDSARVRDLGAEKALIQDYSGRVVYELLQNALDRAERRILIRWDGDKGRLDVANDGQCVSAYEGMLDGIRSDCHALLSLHSSAKRAAESIGNKGVGFRSVFSVTQEVRVYSRTEDDGWWGMTLRHPAQIEPAPGTTWMENAVASFYAPQLLMDGAVAIDEFNEYRTVVRLTEVRPERRNQVERTIHELMRLPLHFLCSRVRQPEQLRLVLEIRSEEPEHCERRIDEPGGFASATAIEVPEEVRHETGLDLPKAWVQVLLWGPGGAEHEPGLYWSYLPTEQESGFGIHIHADFYLSNSRRNLALRDLSDNEADSAADPPGWNRRLLRKAAELIVTDLWQRPKVCERDDFWAFATPVRCGCNYLAAEVARLLLREDGRFRELVRCTFSPGAKVLWPVRRYQDFFQALESWADYAYAHAAAAGLPGGKARKRWREWLLKQVEQSQAPVLPILDQEDENASVELARPLVTGRRGDGERIYLRSAAAAAIALPQAVRDQRTFVTTFVPPGANARDAGTHGLLEFSRPEVLAQLRPGDNEREHRQLLLAALQLAIEEPVPGRGESVLSRATALSTGPAWRLLVDRETTLGKAARNLRNLHVPILPEGWLPAREVARADGGPWPRLDECALAQLLQAFGGDGAAPPTVDAACLLLGISVVPIGDDGAIADWPQAPGADLARSLLAAWRRDLHPLFQQGQGLQGTEARRQLQSGAWLHEVLFGETELLGGRIEPGRGPGAPYAPQALWRQGAQRGFRTRLLPRLIIADEKPAPPWALDLGVEEVPRANCLERIGHALNRLCGDPAALENDSDLIATYRNLVDGALRAAPELPSLPLLYRQVDQDGRISSLKWGRPGDDIWHDPGGAASSALSAFRDVRIWVYRQAPQEKAERLGAIHFAPSDPKIHRDHGEAQPELAARLKVWLWRALPDLLAAAALDPVAFDHQEAIRRQATLAVEHSERVWIEWTFSGKTATRGLDESGDVFLLRPPGGGAPIICFDGHEPPLVECAYPLSELLCESRAFGPLFRDGLYAWSQAEHQGDQAPAVHRFRRDHNLSDPDVAHWRAQLEAARLAPELETEWRRLVRALLGQYGQLSSDAPGPGDTITPGTWSQVTQDADLSQDGLRNQLKQALGHNDAFQSLVPAVDFSSYHCKSFLTQWEKNRLTYIAAVADQRGRHCWTESLLDELTALGDGVPTEEQKQQFSRLRFDPDKAWRRHFELPLEDELTPSAPALQFATGEILLDHLPDQAAGVVLQPFAAGSAVVARPAVQDDDWLRQQRRKMAGGHRAEAAVLGIAVERARQWQEADLESFQQAVKQITKRFGNLAEQRAHDLGTPEALHRFLHVAEYIGNAGFDVLVPDQPGRRFQLVEVKRVASLQGEVRFFLSENERRQAQDLKAQGQAWCLWLVGGNNSIVDATRALDTFDAHQGQVKALLDAGLRPGEWMLALTLA